MDDNTRIHKAKHILAACATCKTGISTLSFCINEHAYRIKLCYVQSTDTFAQIYCVKYHFKQRSSSDKACIKSRTLSQQPVAGCQLRIQNKIALFRNVIPVLTQIANSFDDLRTKSKSATGNSVADTDADSEA